MSLLHDRHSKTPEEHNADWAPFSHPPASLHAARPFPASGAIPGTDLRSFDDEKLDALVELGRELTRQNYAWTCPSARTQEVVNGRFSSRRANNLTDLFGWNRIGTADLVMRQLPAGLFHLLCEVGVLQINDGETVRSRVRFSSFADTLVAQSAGPELERPDVVVGPDMHRAGAFMAREILGSAGLAALPDQPVDLVDLGCGSGAAGILAARMLGVMVGDSPARVVLADDNPRALRYAEVNARLANLSHFACRPSVNLAEVSDAPWLVVANPADELTSGPHAAPGDFRDLGTAHAVRIVDQCLESLLPGGHLMMCALAPMVEGVDILLRSIEPRIMRTRYVRPSTLRYEVLESDIHGDRLSLPAYADVDRLALVGVSIHVKRRK